MTIDHDNLEEYADPADYDVENTLDEEADFFLAAARRHGAPVLDLACGTGRLTIPIARLGLRCVGVDLAAPMIEHARRKSAGLPVEYRVGDCRELALDERFGFVLMTGHAWQALLSDDDQRAALDVVARHLRPGGGFVFENRNPAAHDLAAEERIAWVRSYQDAAGRWIDAQVVARFDPATSIQHCRQERRDRESGRVAVSRIALRYDDDAHTRTMIEAAGLRVAAVHGDWTAGPARDGCDDFVYVCERPAT